MRIADMNWMQVEDYLTRDDRVVLPLGSVEQHAYLSLATDAILAERVAVEAARPLGVPVYPALPFGLTPYFMGYPGTVTLRPQTYSMVVVDLLDSLVESGFRRVALVNGHGGNASVREAVEAWEASRPEVGVLMYDWWRAPATRARVEAVDPVAGHASWMENFPWTRVPGVELPEEAKEPVELDERLRLDPVRMRERLGDGSFGGAYERGDEELAAVWEVAVNELRERLEDPWEERSPSPAPIP